MVKTMEKNNHLWKTSQEITLQKETQKPQHKTESFWVSNYDVNTIRYTVYHPWHEFINTPVLVKNTEYWKWEIAIQRRRMQWFNDP